MPKKKKKKLACSTHTYTHTTHYSQYFPIHARWGLPHYPHVDSRVPAGMPEHSSELWHPTVEGGVASEVPRSGLRSCDSSPLHSWFPGKLFRKSHHSLLPKPHISSFWTAFTLGYTICLVICSGLNRLYLTLLLIRVFLFCVLCFSIGWSLQSLW